MGDTVLYEAADGVATLTLNRPERLNTITPELIEDFRAALARAQDDDEVRAIRLRGAGRGVLRGLRHRLGLGVDGRGRGAASRGTRSPTTRRCRASSTPTWRCGARPSRSIAQVHGYCVGGGTDFALCSDLIVCAEDAAIGYPPARVWGSPTTAMWMYRLGLERSKRLLLTGDAIDGRRAVEWGLASEAVPADELDAAGAGAGPARRAAAPQPAAHDEAAGQPGLRADGPAHDAAHRDAARRRGAPHARGRGLHAARAGGRRRGRGRRATARSATTGRAPATRVRRRAQPPIAHIDAQRLDEARVVDVVLELLAPHRVADDLLELVVVAPARSGPRRSVSLSENRHVRSRPSAVRRMRLQSPQNGSETGLMKPIAPVAVGEAVDAGGGVRLALARARAASGSLDDRADLGAGEHLSGVQARSASSGMNSMKRTS